MTGRLQDSDTYTAIAAEAFEEAREKEHGEVDEHDTYPPEPEVAALLYAKAQSAGTLAILAFLQERFDGHFEPEANDDDI